MTVTAAGVRIITQVPVPPTAQLVVAAATAQAVISTAQAVIATTQAGIATTQAGLATTNGEAQVDLAEAQAGIATAQAVIATEAAAEAEATVGASSNIQLLNWAYVQSFAITSATRNSNDVITTASIVWPDSATGTFTADRINAAYNAIDAWHATHILSGTTKTVTQTAVTRNSNGAVTAQPVITIS